MLRGGAEGRFRHTVRDLPHAETYSQDVNDFEEAARSMREQEGRKESIFRQSVENERNKSDLLEKKFQEAVRRAKETPDTPGKPLRDFDLD